MSAPSFAFPQPLAEKYRPRAIADFIGLERPKRIMANFARNPRSAAFLFTGPSGTGKTTMALALCDAIGGRANPYPISALHRRRARGIAANDAVRPDGREAILVRAGR